MNSMQIKDKLRNVANKKEISFNTILRLYMYDRFIERLAISRYKDNFILKGGFYLSTLFGIENRTTMDIDTAFKNANFTENNIKRMITSIINIDLEDNAKLELVNISTIRNEDIYKGFTVVINVKIDNMKENFQIDIATGDPITPKEINYQYLPILGENKINLWAYNIETVLAEKIETILSRLEANSRIRDYYDIYLIYTKDWKNLNKNNFKKAVEKTFEKREFNEDIGKSFTIIKNSKLLQTRWEDYSKKYNYAKNISFIEVIECLDKVITEII